MVISIQQAAHIHPSARQLHWQKLEFYSFIHFSINTFTDREWGMGDESPTLFAPEQLDAEQWVRACQSAGMRGLILTCKHHDGFCLWPSEYTDHSVQNSPWRNGQGDLVKEVSDACRKAGLKFGIYLSPWDRHEPTYGDSEAYNDYFVHQLEELLTGYGELFSVWFDGACGEGKQGKKQVYDWDRYYAVIRRLQPQAVISVCGPDVRWCGNEAGHTRSSEWSVVPESMQDNEKIQANSQTEDNGEFATLVRSDEDDLGSRHVIAEAQNLIWYPAEVNTSIRPGWFYHPAEDHQVKTSTELMELYERIVGGNACFLLNIPPDRRGLIHEQDVEQLQLLGQKIKQYYQHNIAENALIQASLSDQQHPADHAIDQSEDTFWCTPYGVEQAEIELDLGSIQNMNRVVLMEHIQSGQRIEAFAISYQNEHQQWVPCYQGSIVGYKHICRFSAITTQHIRISIIESRYCPTLQSIEVYEVSIQQSN